MGFEWEGQLQLEKYLAQKQAHSYSTCLNNVPDFNSLFIKINLCELHIF